MIRKIEKIINEIIVELISATRKLDTLANQLGNKKKSSNEDLDLNYFSKDNFLKLRFKNRDEEYKEYLKLSKIKGKNHDFTAEANLESEIDDMRYSIIFRPKENRYMGRFTYNGKREYAYGKTRSECLHNLRQKKKEVVARYSNESINKKIQLNTWFDYWFENIKGPQVKESTRLKLAELYDRHIRRTIGEKSVKKITTPNLQDFIKTIQSYDAKKKVHRILKQVFKVLYALGEVKRDPMALVFVPKEEDETVIKTKVEEKIISYSEEIIFFESIKNAKCYFAAKFILYTGLRRGECLGLQWKHINFKELTITVEQQLNRTTNKITKPKTKAGIRTVPLIPESLQVLKELYHEDINPEEFIFNDLDRLTQQLNYFSQKTNIKVNPHILRHTFISRCYFTGLDPKIIQTIVGHESIETTLNTYTHVLDKEDNELVKKMREYFVKLGLINTL